MSRRVNLTDAEKADILARAEQSAAMNGGVPDVGAVSAAVGRDPKVVQRIWLSRDPEASARRPPPAPADTSTAPLRMTDVEWWSWRWTQHQEELSRAESDVAREKLLRAQDDLRAHYRASVEVESKKTGRTPDEIAARLERAAETMPPAVAARVVGVLRRRGLAG